MRERDLRIERAPSRNPADAAASPASFGAPSQNTASERGPVGHHPQVRPEIEILGDKRLLFLLGVIERVHPTDSQAAAYTGWPAVDVAASRGLLERNRAIYIDFDGRFRPTHLGLSTLALAGLPQR
jgi:hypothetical protein